MRTRPDNALEEKCAHSLSPRSAQRSSLGAVDDPARIVNSHLKQNQPLA